MGGKSSKKPDKIEQMLPDDMYMADDENKTQTVCDNSDVDKSGDKWTLQKSADCAQSDEGETYEASGWDDMQSSSDKWTPPDVEDCAIGIIQSNAVDKTLAQICQSFENIGSDLWKKMSHLGPAKTGDYIQKHLNGWKTENVRFAIAGRSATGKSTFINTFRGSKEGQVGFANVGFGDEGRTISEYKHPENENIILCDLPGLSMKFTKPKFLKMVNLSSYHYIFIFFESVLTEDDEWLTVQIQQKGIPFCLVRSKIDNEVMSRRGRQIGKECTLQKIRHAMKDSMATNVAFAKAKLFLISSERPNIGDMSNLQGHIEENLPSNKYTAVMLSLPILTDAVIEKKLLELKKRIPYVSIGTAILTLFTFPLRKNLLNTALINREVRHYVKVFGLDQKYDERIEGLTNNFSEVSVEDFVERMLGKNYQNRSIVPLIAGDLPCVCIISALLPAILSELKQDAITVYMHFLNKGSR